ncbi:sensor histidine kinase [Actinomadura sp. NPDC049382]|uniref:sensor histidine kinase n=1 Tax=Actinomadura sp. NPDC049382 TaxID=3158220 RepID=UPI00343B70C6
MDDRTSSERMRFAPEILRRLGEELVPHPDLGIIELVRNSYDADATRCTVELIDVEAADGTIRVTDVGDGMTRSEIRDGFLLLGKSSKTNDEFTKRRHRRKVGEKGLGRLAALRLGRSVTLMTRPLTEPGTEYRLDIEWDDFERAVAVEDIALQVHRTETSARPGTTIEIRHMRKPMRRNDVERLARSLVMLTGPFPGPNPDFVAELRSPEFPRMETLVRKGFFEICDFLLRAQFDDNGRISASLSDRHGTVLAEANTEDVMRRSPDRRGKGQTLGFLAPPRAELEIWMFNLNTVSYDGEGNRQAGLRTAVSNWLKEVGGIHVYDRGLRVHPYGDPGYDWVEMEALRGSNPEVRPGTNNSVGRIILSDGVHRLTPKTDRSGFVEDISFHELREFIRAALEWAAYKRIEWRDEKLREKRAQTKTRVKETRDAVDKLLKVVPRESREIVRKAIVEERAASNERLQVMENDLALYRTMSTVGTTTAVFAHETLRPVDTIEQMIGSVERRGRRELQERYDTVLAKPVALITRAAESLRTFAELPLELLKNKKRQSATLDVNRVVPDLVSTFSPYLEDAQVEVTYDLSVDAARVRSTVASIEAIAANVLANAVAMFAAIPSSAGQRLPLAADARSNPSKRTILIRTSVSPTHVHLAFLDNGPGIKGLTEDEVWLPGLSTREGGTGLGLTIVRDIVADLQGKVWAVAAGDLGGAEFHISLPRTGSKA